MSKRTGRRSSTSESAVSQAAVEVPSNLADLQAAIAKLRDASLSAEERLSVLRAVQAASFSFIDFGEARAEYLAALRDLTDDADENLRQRALGILARENDKFVQKLLLDGLKSPEKAVVEPEKALQLLGYNAHAGVYSIAREIVGTPPSLAAKREAIRLLASDPQSVKLIEDTLSNKKENAEIRQISASALHALHPERLQRWAEKAVADNTETADMIATSLTALQEFGDADALANNKVLLKRIAKLRTRGPAKVRQSAGKFTKK